ncbi:hypothetical protein [Trinickia mobilis]|uniref:hypothetical protein n=1 Tax=Trinickia mobilis TaxID=2816356 RepID=UPI001A8D7F1E|nr:hypothetical protein [Trinickia mobilis]
MSTRDEVIDIARTWLRTPYRHEGRVKGAGVDCAMLLCEVYHEAGLIPYIDPRPYPQDWALHRSKERYLGWVEKFGHEVAVPQRGDLALYRFGRCYSHGVIVIDWPGEIIHSYRDLGVLLDRGDAGYLMDRQVRFFTLWEA